MSCTCAALAGTSGTSCPPINPHTTLTHTRASPAPHLHSLVNHTHHSAPSAKGWGPAAADAGHPVANVKYAARQRSCHAAVLCRWEGWLEKGEVCGGKDGVGGGG